jgi:hypothetical protein
MKFKNLTFCPVIVILLFGCSKPDGESIVIKTNIYELLSNADLNNKEVSFGGYLALDVLSESSAYIYPYKDDAERDMTSRGIVIEGIALTKLKACLNSYIHIQATVKQYERYVSTYKYLTSVTRIATNKGNVSLSEYKVCFKHENE